MTLSGYLFAKLLDGKSINYAAFIWNRVLRLIPLLFVVILIAGIISMYEGGSLVNYAHVVAKGVLFPCFPNGGWSITVEFHFYLILPLLLWLLRKSSLWPFIMIVAAILLRFFLWHERGEVQSLAYFTIIGRIDQFALGMLAFKFGCKITRRHLFAIAIISSFLIFYWWFDLHGGFQYYPTYPSPRPLWILLPTIEGIGYAIGIAWYDKSFSHSTSGLSKFIGRIGEFSYSIYLLHIFVFFYAAKFVNTQIMEISNFYLACLWSLVFLIFMMLPGYVSFRFVESPFLRLRKRYVGTKEIPSNTGQSLPGVPHPTGKPVFRGEPGKTD